MSSLRILSYNVRYFGHSTRGLASTRTSMRRIAEAIAALRPLPAIACLQEVETRSIRSTLAHPGETTQLERFMEMLSKARALGFDLRGAQLAKAFAEFQALADRQRDISDDEVRAICARA